MEPDCGDKKRPHCYHSPESENLNLLLVNGLDDGPENEFAMASNGTPLDFSRDYIQIINGKSAATEQTRHGINPANKQALPPVPVATEKDLDNAVAAGKVAFEIWSRTPFEERQKATIAYADAVEAHSAAFVELLTREQGRPVSFDHRSHLW
jgi:delta 1-pyrroline-5-carboxylate dehydrogenase